MHLPVIGRATACVISEANKIKARTAIVMKEDVDWNGISSWTFLSARLHNSPPPVDIGYWHLLGTSLICHGRELTHFTRPIVTDIRGGFCNNSVSFIPPKDFSVSFLLTRPACLGCPRTSCRVGLNVLGKKCPTACVAQGHCQPIGEKSLKDTTNQKQALHATDTLWSVKYF